MGNSFCKIKREKETTNKANIQDLCECIYDSIIQADKKVSNNTIHSLSEYFEISEDNIYTPKSIKVNINGEIVQVPIITLISQNHMKIQDLKVTLNPEILIGENIIVDGRGIDKIEIHIKSSDTPENIQRMVNKLYL